VRIADFLVVVLLSCIPSGSRICYNWDGYVRLSLTVPVSPLYFRHIVEIENRKNDPTGILHQAYERIGQTVEEVSPKLVKIIEQCTREGEGGQFVDYDGGRNDW
jgi:hypothetical protein